MCNFFQAGSIRSKINSPVCRIQKVLPYIQGIRSGCIHCSLYIHPVKPGTIIPGIIPSRPEIAVIYIIRYEDIFILCKMWMGEQIIDEVLPMGTFPFNRITSVW